MRVTRRALLSGVAASGVLVVTGCADRSPPPLLTGPATPQDLDDAPRTLADDTNAWLEIDRAAFIHNLRLVRARIPARVKHCLVLKGDAYGHGIDLLMPAVLAEGATTIGITGNREARQVRRAGFQGALIRIRTGTIAEIEAGMALNLEEVIGNLDLARQAAMVARNRGRPLRVHFMLNSGGISRNGMELSTDRGKADALALVALEGLEIVGLATHYPKDTIADCDAGAQRFDRDCTWLIEAAGLDRNSLTLHSAKSFAALKVPGAIGDMVRTGRALYGLMGKDLPEFQGIATYKSRIATINRGHSTTKTV